MTSPSIALISAVVDAALSTRRDALPIELNSTARALGARDVLYRAQTQGYTRWSDDGPRILLALTRSDGRRRATLAHECGHLLVDPLVQAESFLQMSPANQQSWNRKVTSLLGYDLSDQLTTAARIHGVERVCDLFSHELLLPFRCARGVRDAWTGELNELRELANQYRVSLSMLAIRLNSVQPGYTLLTLKATPQGRWIAVRTISAPRWLRSRVQCTFDDAHNWPFDGERRISVLLETAHGSLRVEASVICAGLTRIVLLRRPDLEANSGEGRMPAFAQLPLDGPMKNFSPHLRPSLGISAGSSIPGDTSKLVSTLSSGGWQAGRRSLERAPGQE
ncbi:MAG: ImmA/IrrE family metallo-endopeptidase [Actinobacteria bacterium]|nr:ImmA/IrrE family metallo-endopeptidase [Actinomycetota bacterium]